LKGIEIIEEFFEKWLEIQLLLEEFTYFKYKRASLFDYDSLEVEKSSLVKLKGRLKALSFSEPHLFSSLGGNEIIVFF
jgi:hypothetical protein